MDFITPNSIYGYNKNIQIILLIISCYFISRIKETYLLIKFYELSMFCNMIESLENKNFIKGIIPLKSLKTALQFDVP